MERWRAFGWRWLAGLECVFSLGSSWLGEVDISGPRFVLAGGKWPGVNQNRVTLDAIIFNRRCTQMGRERGGAVGVLRVEKGKWLHLVADSHSGVVRRGWARTKTGNTWERLLHVQITSGTPQYFGIGGEQRWKMSTGGHQRCKIGTKSPVDI